MFENKLHTWATRPMMGSGFGDTNLDSAGAVNKENRRPRRAMAVDLDSIFEVAR